MSAQPENQLIIHTFSEADILKFNEGCVKLYQTINPDKIAYKNINITNVQTKYGLMSVFNLVIEELVTEERFNEWKRSLKIKNQIIS
jgi:hypothetical protein